MIFFQYRRSANILRSYEIITINNFCVRHKNRQKHNQHFKLLFFKENLQFGTSEQISVYIKLSLLTVKSIFWSSLLEKGKEDSYRPMYTTSFFTLPEKKCLANLKMAQLQKTFPQVCISSIKLASMNVFSPCDNWKTLFLYKFSVYPEVWCSRHVPAFFETSLLKEVCILCPLPPQ